MADTATLAVFNAPNKRPATSFLRCVVTGVPLSGVSAFWIVREATSPRLIANTFAEGCATTEQGSSPKTESSPTNAAASTPDYAAAHGKYQR